MQLFPFVNNVAVTIAGLVCLHTWVNVLVEQVPNSGIVGS